MREPQQQQTLRADEEATLVVSGEETTLVSPRFDDEETLVARPVVPLDAEAVEAAGAHEPAAAPHAARLPPTYASRPFAPRRTWVLATVLVSVLVGGVLGGAGLYIYQRQSQDDRAVTTTPPQPAAPAETQPEPAAEVSNAPLPEAPAPAVAEPASDGGETADPPAREPEVEPAAGRSEDREAAAPAGPRKRGKKGENDAEVERRAPRPDAVRPVARAEDDGARGARRVDSIVYRPRRAARRARRDAADTDRLRRIFEGTPE